ncbi:glycosyltransferase [Paenibacillus daejeonensis]|uniref:glycosyltransferase n=1 Tax=Paenibacillus daejeonensis TaxID=135193 RepID=UPI00036B001F|nr:glycosyltransferase [Paenibacillus daejeonensis]
MRIAVFADYFPALSETFVLNQVTGLLDRGHEVDIYATAPRQENTRHPDVAAYNLDARCRYRQMPPGKLARYAKLLPLLARHLFKAPGALLGALNPIRYGREASSLNLFYSAVSLLEADRREYDIIYCHFGPTGKLAAALQGIGLLKGKLITTFHGADITSYLQQRGEQVYRELFRQGDLFLPISERWRTQLMKLGCPEERITIHRMGIDSSRFAYRPPVEGEDMPLRLVTIARLVEKKGVAYAIQAAAALAAEGREVKYTIIGDGPLREELQQLILSLEMGEHIRLVGPKGQNEVLNILRQSDLMVAPSVTAANGDQEGIPVVLMEAMAIGLPIVSTWHSGIPELVEDGASGYLVPERDEQGLAHKLKLLMDNRHQWPEMSRRGREIVEQSYDIHRLNERLEDIFLQLLIQPGASREVQARRKLQQAEG